MWIEIDPEDRISEVEYDVSRITGINKSQIRLIFKGKHLKEV